MTKIEFLSASLPYQLKVKVLCGDGVFDTNEDLTVQLLYELGHSRLTPIVRHLDDLVKECIQADYNEGKPFVPIVELLENSYFNTSIMPRAEIMSFAHSFSRIELITLNALSLYLKWHFDLITEPCEKVYVTDEFNPYK